MKTVLQAFEWYLPADSQHWQKIASLAPDLKSLGFTGLWLPPASKGAAGINDVGYGTYDLFDLGEFDQKGTVPTKYGTKDDYLKLIQALHEHGVRVTWLCSALFNHSFSFEAVFHWHDQWQPTHAVHLSPQARARLQEPAANPQARALVATLREETCALFVQMGAASNQIGRTYPYLDNLAPSTRQLLQGLKQQQDPARRMSLGVLGL